MDSAVKSVKFLNASEVAEILNVSQSFAYKLIAKLNKELESNGKIIVHGRISQNYFLSRIQ